MAKDTTGRFGDGERLLNHAGRLRLLVLHLAGAAIRARVDPEDVVQEIYLRAMTSPSGLPEPGSDGGEGPLWAFLARVARNTVVDVARAIRGARRAGRVQPLERDEWSRLGAAEPAARTAGPATRVAAAETQAELEAAFDRLTPDHRRVIGLRQLEGLSAAETGRRMGRSESAVHSLYRRALEAWEKELPGHSSSDSPEEGRE